MEFFYIPNHIHEPVRTRGSSDNRLPDLAARICRTYSDPHNITDDQTAS